MKQSLSKYFSRVSLVAITALSISSAFADPADLSNMENYGAGVVVGGGTAPNTTGGDASYRINSGFWSANASIGGVNGKGGNNTIGSASITYPIASDSYDPDYSGAHGGALALRHSINSDGNTLRVTPIAIGQEFITRTGNTKVGVFASPWNYESDLNNDLVGNSASLSANFQTNLKNIVLLHAAAEAGLVYGESRKYLTQTKSTQTQTCSPSNPSNCQNVYQEVTSQTSPGYRQRGNGSYARLEGGLSVRLGEHLIGDASAYAEKRTAPLQEVDYIAGPGARATLDSTNYGVRVGVATAF